MNSKRILIISNNVLSLTNNNGKTLLSLFSLVENAEIAQLYFSNEKPEISNYAYFKMSDSDIINLKFKNKKTYGPQKYVNRHAEIVQIAKKHGVLSRLLREFMWCGVHHNPDLQKWVIDFNPTHIFFVGGDCLFAYKIFDCLYNMLDKKPKCSLFITDDYISCKGIINTIEILRRKLIKKAISDALKNVEYFFTISNKMKLYYKSVFGVDSKVLFNIQISKTEKTSCNKILKTPQLLYAGSLYYGRDKSLADFILNTNNLKLLVCSNQTTNNKKFNKAIKQGKIEFLGKLDFNELNALYNKVDYLLYVESFKKRFINKIRYSFSTKITDYLSSSLPIVCYGPDVVGSIEELSEYSLFIGTRKFDLKIVEEQLLNDKKRSILVSKSRRGFSNVLNIAKVRKHFMEALQ